MERMMNIPVRFRRLAAAFHEMSRDRSWESSGSEHMADLSDLVNSFFEREISDRQIRNSEEAVEQEVDGDEIRDDENESNSLEQIELRNSLKKLFDFENDVVRRSIRAEVEAALGDISGEKDLSPEFKRQLMARLRSRGLDAGLCKSKWDKNGRYPSGSYEYIDINSGAGIRYIVEIHLAGEFTIARQTSSYTSILEDFPRIFVGRPEALKKVVKLMTKAVRKTMKSVNLSVPPWRRLSYMQAKWFGFYRRTVNEVPAVKASMAVAGTRSVGFIPVAAGSTSFYCRSDFGVRNGGRIGNLTAAFS